MAKIKKHINILLSCPTDITEELSIIRKVIEEYNQGEDDLHIDLKHWLSDTFPSVGTSAQDIINSQIVLNADMVIAIFWTRFGTKTNRFDSGTEEEIVSLMERNKNVFLYFCDKPVSPSKHDPNQIIKVMDFKNKFKNKGLYWEYDSTESFTTHFRRHIMQFFNNYKKMQSTKESIYNAFHQVANYIINHQYYYNRYFFSMDIKIDESEKVIYKNVSRQIEILSFEQNACLENFIVASHKSNNVQQKPTIDNIYIDIDDIEETDYLVDYHKNKSSIESKKGFTNVTKIILNKPLKINKQKPLKIAISYRTKVSISNKVHTVRLDAPCKNANFNYQIIADNLAKYKAVASGFGATNINGGFLRPVERDDTLSLTHDNWLLPKDGVVFCLLQKKD